jgi:myo-inositol-1(or 4)-monophosphatase
MKNTLYKAAIESGKIIKEYFEGSFKIESKDIISNLVTEVDKKSEAKIIEIIKADFPEHNILSEEIGALKTDSEIKWVIDPIDGTINYAHKIPICCVSIGIEKAGEIIYGLVYNPIDGEMFYAEKGKGAFYKDEKISVSKESDLRKSLLVTGFPYVSKNCPYKPVESFSRFLNMDIPIRRLGSAALDLCWTALGRFDGFWEYNLNPWDVAAGYLIMTEAGGTVTDFNGEKFSIYGKEILASNGLIHGDMLKVLQNL